MMLKCGDDVILDKNPRHKAKVFEIRNQSVRIKTTYNGSYVISSDLLPGHECWIQRKRLTLQKKEEKK